MIQLQETEIVFGHTNEQMDRRTEPDGQTNVEVEIDIEMLGTKGLISKNSA